LWFPAVGLALGGLVLVFDWLLRERLPGSVTSAIALALLFLSTRGLHTDGLMDAADGLLGGHTRERRLEIMRDARVGAFAVAAVVLVTLLKFSALIWLPYPHRAWGLLLFPLQARWAMTLAMYLLPYARAQGAGSALQGSAGLPTLVALVLTTVLSFVLGGWGGLVTLGVASGVAVAFGAVCAVLLGGMTGDTYGAVNELAEASVLITAVALVPYGWINPGAMLW
jgi:adenosylcobinamide-GDP ribazoletransferase